MIMKTAYKFLIAAALGLMFAYTPTMAQSELSQQVLQDIKAATNAADDTQELTKLGHTNPFAAMIVAFKLYDVAENDNERKLAVQTMMVAVMRCKDSEEYMEGMKQFVSAIIEDEFETFLEWLGSELQKYDTAE